MRQHCGKWKTKHKQIITTGKIKLDNFITKNNLEKKQFRIGYSQFIQQCETFLWSILSVVEK